MSDAEVRSIRTLGRVIFLDFDGVLNHPGTWQAWIAARRIDASRDGSPGRSPDGSPDGYPDRSGEVGVPTDARCVARVNRLVAWTGARVVISSSWRYVAPYPVLARALACDGLVAEVIGQTADHRIVDDWSLVLAFLAEKKKPTTRVPRGAEIATWLRHHPGVTSYVVLDDVDDMEHVRRRFVQTDGSRGISNEDVDRAASILAQPLPVERRRHRR